MLRRKGKVTKITKYKLVLKDNRPVNEYVEREDNLSTIISEMLYNYLDPDDVTKVTKIERIIDNTGDTYKDIVIETDATDEFKALVPVERETMNRIFTQKKGIQNWQSIKGSLLSLGEQ